MAVFSPGGRQARYKVTNWREYNESLVRRGDITFWFDEDVIDAWEHDNAEWKVGRPVCVQRPGDRNAAHVAGAVSSPLSANRRLGPLAGDAHGGQHRDSRL